MNVEDVKELARALFEARFPQYGEDGFDGAGEWWQAKCREQAALILSRLTAAEGEPALEFTNLAYACNECGRDVPEVDAGPSCGAHILHIECGRFFTCRECELVWKEIRDAS